MSAGGSGARIPFGITPPRQSRTCLYGNLRIHPPPAREQRDHGGRRLQVRGKQVRAQDRCYVIVSAARGNGRKLILVHLHVCVVRCKVKSNQLTDATMAAAKE
jgi:hypothetical protein